MLVGEQPGDQEDKQGRPFVGPAGKMLSSALAQAGIDREAVYVTNAVKHFKWKPAGKRRIHETPRASEIRACLPWLEAEIEAIKPALVICLGGTATHSLLGPSVGVLVNRGKVLETAYGPCLITIHPSALLRVADADEQRSEIAAFVADLGRAMVYLDDAAPEVAAKVRK
jgi:DNA polymerase